MSWWKTNILFVCLAAAGAEPLTLESALEIAGKANPDVQLARIRTLESEALALRERSALRPQLTGIVQSAWQVTNLAGIGLTFPGLDERIGPFSTFNARPQLSMTVVDLSLVARSKAAQLRVNQAREDAASVRESVLGAVIQYYLLALQSESRWRAARARLASSEELLRQVSDKESAGTANRLDVARAREQVERERIQVVYARRDRDALATQLVRALGLENTTGVELAEGFQAQALPADRPAAVNEAIALRPEMKSLTAKRAVLQRELEAASRQRWPKFDVTADFGAFGPTIPSSVSTYIVAGTMQVPIYTGGRISSEIKAARHRLEMWEQERRRMEIAIAQEVAQSWLEAEAAESARGSAAQAAGAARESLELAKLRYEAGLSTNLDVVTAQSNLAQAEEEEIRTRFDSLLARARLAQARGNASGFLAPR